MKVIIPQYTAVEKLHVEIIGSFEFEKFDIKEYRKKDMMMDLMNKFMEFISNKPYPGKFMLGGIKETFKPYEMPGAHNKWNELRIDAIIYEQVDSELINAFAIKE